jgi:hypothetical protein
MPRTCAEIAPPTGDNTVEAQEFLPWDALLIMYTEVRPHEGAPWWSRRAPAVRSQPPRWGLPTKSPDREAGAELSMLVAQRALSAASPRRSRGACYSLPPISVAHVNTAPHDGAIGVRAIRRCVAITVSWVGRIAVGGFFWLIECASPRRALGERAAHSPDASGFPIGGSAVLLRLAVTIHCRANVSK